MSTRPPLASKQTSDIDLQSIQLLTESYALSVKYVHEYMDENPIVGEPGAFKFSKARDSALSSMASSKPSSQSQTLKVAKPATGITAPKLKTEDLPAPIKKANKGGEKSPVTPSSSTKEKKSRRKSKAAGARDTITPKLTTPETTTPK